MPTALSLAPLTLSVVLVLSGIAKLREPGATSSMIRALKLPPILRRRMVAQALPWVELLTAALLLTPWRWAYALGAAAATALFLAFLLVIARAMTFTPRPTCGCFGRVGDHQVSARTVLRNALLLALAGVAGGIAIFGGSAGALIAQFTTGDWVWLTLALTLAAIAVFILGRPGASSYAGDFDAFADAHADSGLRGTTRQVSVPAGVVVDSELHPSSLAALTRPAPQLLILVNCWCGSTYETIKRLPGWRDRLPHLGMPLVHTRAPWGEPRLADVPDVLWDPGSQLFAALEASNSPCAVLLGTGGTLIRGPISGVEGIEDLIDTLSESPAASAT